MDLFRKAKTVRLRSTHGKFLTAEEDEESVTQDRNGSSASARWAVEFVGDDAVRLRGRYGKYLTASNQPFLLGMTGRKVVQARPRRLDSSVEWEPVGEKGGALKLRTRYGRFLRANGGVPPWRNSVTHDASHRTTTMEWMVWEVHVMEIVVGASAAEEGVLPAEVSEVGSGGGSGYYSSNAGSFSRQESNDSFASSPPKGSDGRLIYFHIAGENGKIDEGFEELCITFKGYGVDELTWSLAKELGIDGVTVCARSPLNGKLYPLRLQLPPKNATMHVVVVPPSSSQVLQDSEQTQNPV